MEQYKYFDYQRAIPEPVPHIVVATKDDAPLDHPSSWCFDFATANAVKGQPACWGAYMDESVSVWSSDQSYFSSSSMPDDCPTLGAGITGDMSSKGLVTMTDHDTTTTAINSTTAAAASLGVLFAHDLSAGPEASPLSRSRLYPASHMTRGMIDSHPHPNHQQRDGHQCLWARCGLWCSTLEQLTIHIRDEHVGSGKPAYFCQWAGCPRNRKPFTKRHKMHNHMRTHTGERPFECTVKGCNKKFSRPDSLSTHIKTHSNIRPYNCSVPGCGKAYFHSRSLRKHMRSHEEEQSPGKNSSANSKTSSAGAAAAADLSNNALLSPTRYSHHYAPYRISSRIKRNSIVNPLYSNVTTASLPPTIQNQGFFPIIDPSTTTTASSSTSSWPYNSLGFTC